MKDPNLHQELYKVKSHQAIQINHNKLINMQQQQQQQHNSNNSSGNPSQNPSKNHIPLPQNPNGHPQSQIIYKRNSYQGPVSMRSLQQMGPPIQPIIGNALKADNVNINMNPQPQFNDSINSLNKVAPDIVVDKKTITFPSQIESVLGIVTFLLLANIVYSVFINGIVLGGSILLYIISVLIQIAVSVNLKYLRHQLSFEKLEQYFSVIQSNEPQIKYQVCSYTESTSCFMKTKTILNRVEDTLNIVKHKDYTSNIQSVKEIKSNIRINTNFSWKCGNQNTQQQWEKLMQNLLKKMKQQNEHIKGLDISTVKGIQPNQILNQTSNILISKEIAYFFYIFGMGLFYDILFLSTTHKAELKVDKYVLCPQKLLSCNNLSYNNLAQISQPQIIGAGGSKNQFSQNIIPIQGQAQGQYRSQFYIPQQVQSFQSPTSKQQQSSQLIKN